MRFRFSKILIVADDVKTYTPVNSMLDVDGLQSDLTSLNDWCSVNSMSCNLSKCKKMSFHWVSQLPTCYSIINQLENVTCLKVLSVLFDYRVTLSVSKAKSILGFIERSAKELNDPYFCKNFYTLRWFGRF